jgi:Tol biopolymer transport system component/DNA-binding winged helix-turn-helix (wHTH) protein
MAAPAPSRVRYRFGPFLLDLDARELLKDGKPLHTAAQTLRLLELLLTHAGRLVTREQVRQTLWPDGTFVNFERGINSAVRRLRALLGDSDEAPAYVATLTGQGYRFIAAVEREPVGEAPPDATPAQPLPSAPSSRRSPARRWVLAAAIAVALWAGAGGLWSRFHAAPQVLRIHALTTDGGMDLPARPASDGKLLYYLDRAGGGWNLMRSDGNPGDAQRLPPLFPGRSTRLLDVSRDGGEWLLGSFLERGEEAALWRQPAAGGAPVRLGGLHALDAVWSPDGAAIFYSSGDALWQARSDGNNPQRLAGFSGNPDWLAFSPDGRTLGFTANSPNGVQALWQWTPAAGARLLPASRPRCCAAWSRDGRYLLFSQLQTDGIWDLFVQPTAHWPRFIWPWFNLRPRQLTFGPHSSWGAFTGFGDREVVFYQQLWREEAVRFRPASLRTDPLLPGRNAIQIVYSPDGRRLAYVDTRDSTVWTADVDAQLRAASFRQISSPGLIAAFPRWSPDGQWIVFAGQTAGQPSRIYKVAAAGGPVAQVTLAGLAPTTQLVGPDFSPDGSRLVVSVDLEGTGATIGIVRGDRLTLLPAAQGYGSARWSPDGRWLAAYSSDQRRLALYNFSSRRWQVVAHGNAFTGPLWSSDGYVYFQDLLAPGEPLFRYRPGARAPEQVAEFSAILDGGVHRCGFTGLAPDGSLLLSLNRASADLYAASLDLP